MCVHTNIYIHIVHVYMNTIHVEEKKSSSSHFITILISHTCINYSNLLLEDHSGNFGLYF